MSIHPDRRSDPAKQSTPSRQITTSEPPTASGRCLCGAVRYVVTGTPRPVWNCHCRRCRRWTGHFMAASGCRRDELRVISDETLRWHHPEDDPNVAYGFCGRCGSSLFWRVVEQPAGQRERISICAGTLDPPTGLRTERALFVAEAADYHAIDASVESWGRE